MSPQIDATRVSRRTVLIFAALSLLSCLLLLLCFGSPAPVSKPAKTAVVASTNRTTAIVGRISFSQLARVPEENKKAASRLIRRAVWRQHFPDFSWHTVWTTPKSLYSILSLRFAEFVIAPDSAIQVTTRVGKDKDSTRFWWLAKATNGWTVKGEQSVPFFTYIYRQDLASDLPRELAAPGSSTAQSSVSPLGADSYPGFQWSPFQREESLSEWLSNHSRLSLDSGR